MGQQHLPPPACNRWKTEFQYDGWGRLRVWKDYTWDSYYYYYTWSLSSERRYVYDDGMALLQERTSSGTPAVS